MGESYRVFASYLLFQQVLEDPLGHLYRAGEFGRGGVRRIAWLRVFDQALLPARDLRSVFGRVSAVGESIQSANVASGVACLEDDETAGLVCDHVGSQPLGLVFDRVRTEQFPVPIDNALLILEKLSLALSAGLSAEFDGSRVLHGFLHPGLVFVTYDGECVVSGFGCGENLLALVDDDDSADGVHPYLAPEILVSRTPSREGDVYSLGAILFQLLTGSPLPTAAEDRQEAVETAHMAYDEEGLPDDIKSVLLKTLSDRPQDRFSSAADFKKELDRLLYGGAYSPTTFNLALFMDRLFRSEMEAEDRDLEAEKTLDVAPYLEVAAPPEAVPDPIEEDEESSPPLVRKPFMIAAGALVGIMAIVGLWVTLNRGPATPPPQPTPTAEQIAAQRLAQEEKMRELAESLVREMMAEKEDEIRQELADRQQKIDDLQQRLVESEGRARTGQLTNQEQQDRQAIQKQLAAEEAAQRQREAELEAERQRAEEEARQQAIAQQTATAVALEEEARLAATPTPPPPTPTDVPTPEPTAIVVTPNSFFEPSEVDSLPVIVKDHPAEWPPSAQKSRRQGVIILQATVNADGFVEAVKVLRADEEGFGIPRAAEEAAMQYRFKPGTKAGVKIKTYATITVPFRFVFTR